MKPSRIKLKKWPLSREQDNDENNEKHTNIDQTNIAENKIKAETKNYKLALVTLFPY